MNTKNIGSLIELLKQNNIKVSVSDGVESVVPAGISDNSRSAGDGTLFICKGANFKKEYLEDAFARGAVCYMAESAICPDKPSITVDNIRIAMAVTARWFYDFPGDSLIKAGFTGTKGKTSCTTILEEILKGYNGNKVAYFTTHMTNVGGHEYESGLTTPEPVTLHSYLREAVDYGCTHVVMEVSSQAMKMNRIYGERYRVGGFLNIDDDHISPAEHADMDEYLSCKLAFFKQCDTIIINRETRFFERALEAASGNRKVILFGFPGHDTYEPDAVIRNTALTRDGLSFDLEYEGSTIHFDSNLLGLFNIDNIAAAALAAMELGVSAGHIREAVRQLFIPGRLNKFDICGRKVFIDYAHNHLSYENLFSTLRTMYPDEHMTAMIGVNGDRFVKRRKDAGEVTSRYADEIYITEQDPAGMDIVELCKDIAQYISKPYKIVTDREEAIYTALSASKPGDVVVLTGKGAEKSQRMAGYEKPYKGDYEVMRAWEAEHKAQEV